MKELSHSPFFLLLITTYISLYRRTLNENTLPSSTSQFHRHLTHSCSVNKSRTWRCSFKEACLKWNQVSTFEDMTNVIKHLLQDFLSIQASVQRTALNATGHQKFTALQITPQKKSGPRRGGGRSWKNGKRVRRRHGNIQTFLDENDLGLFSVSLFVPAQNVGPRDKR